MSTADAGMRVAKETDAPLEEFSLRDPYFAWQEREGVLVIRDFAFENLSKVELGPWERKGGLGAIINIPNDHLPNDGHIIEIKPGGKSEPERHMYEETTYVIAGRGATSIWHDEAHKQTFEWQPGSLFSIPMNAWYQHFNASGTEPARYISVTNAPPTMRLFDDDDYVFNNPFQFKSRFASQDDYFSGKGTLYKYRVWESNFVPNAPDMPLYSWKERGAGGINVSFRMGKNQLGSHISEFPVGTYKKAHRHGPGAHLIILSGEGFSMLWTKDDSSDRTKADWKRGGMVIVPSDACWHQHFNTGPGRARYLAMHPGDQGAYSKISRAAGRRGNDVSIKEGGYQLEYEDEDRQLHEIFEADLERNGAPCLMKAFVPWCTGEVGPTEAKYT